jgi:hypothetical protein
LDEEDFFGIGKVAEKRTIEPHTIPKKGWDITVK